MVHRRGDCSAMSAGFSGMSNWVEIDSTVGFIRELASNMPTGKRNLRKEKCSFRVSKNLKSAESNANM